MVPSSEIMISPYTGFPRRTTYMAFMSSYTEVGTDGAGTEVAVMSRLDIIPEERIVTRVDDLLLELLLVSSQCASFSTW